MIAQSDKYMSEAAAEIYRMNADEIIKEQCRAREDYYRHERYMKKCLEEAKQEAQAALQRASEAEQETQVAMQRASEAEQETQAAIQRATAAEQEAQAAAQRIKELESLLKQATEHQK